MMKRMWVNQPSGLQLHHDLHGSKVLIDPSTETPGGFVTAYFTEGDVISQFLPLLALSPGWPDRGFCTSRSPDGEVPR